MKYQRRLKLRFTLEALGTKGIESWRLLSVLCFCYFGEFLCLIVVLFASCAWPCHFICGVVLLLVFHGFLIVGFLVLSFLSFESWELVGKDKS